MLFSLARLLIFWEVGKSRAKGFSKITQHFLSKRVLKMGSLVEGGVAIKQISKFILGLIFEKACEFVVLATFFARFAGTFSKTIAKQPVFSRSFASSRSFFASNS